MIPNFWTENSDNPLIGILILTNGSVYKHSKFEAAWINATKSEWASLLSIKSELEKIRDDHEKVEASKIERIQTRKLYKHNIRLR